VKELLKDWLPLVIAVSAFCVIILDMGSYRRQIRMNTKHRIEFSTIDPETMDSLPVQLAALTEQIKSLRRDLVRMEVRLNSYEPQ